MDWKKVNWTAVAVIIALLVNAITIAYSYGSLNQKVENNTVRLQRIEKQIDELLLDHDAHSELLK